MNRDNISLILSTLIVLLIGMGVGLNLYEKNLVDHTKLPPKVEDENKFQRWITNLRNNDINVGADDFKLVEENEIYNTKWMKVYSIDEPGRREEYDQYIASLRETPKVVFSPSDRELLDIRPTERDGYKPNEVHYYGLKEDKIIDARIVDCSVRANCYFDRAYFLSNDVFIITEISRNINKKDEQAPLCAETESCTYTYKLHLVDLINNKRYVYESEPFDTILAELKPEL